MDKLNINPNEEIIITLGNLLDLIDGLAIMSKDMMKIQDKIEPEENQQLLIEAIAIFVAIARLFPSEQKKTIFELLKDEVGIDLTASV